MMKLLSIAALGFVAAADVPVFSSNDDYDEINLNIRLLQSANGTAKANVTEYVVSGDVTTTYTTALTYPALCADVAGPTCTALTGATSAGGCVINSCGDASARRARALQTATDKTIKQTYSLTFASSSEATAASTAIASPTFGASFATALNNALPAGLTASAPVFSAPTTVTTVGGTTAAPTTAAPAPAAAAPSPSPSSDASMLKANVALAAVAALFASMF